jgi:hypothetical protein
MSGRIGLVLQFLGLQRNTGLLLVALVLIGTGEKLRLCADVCGPARDVRP